MSFTGAEQILLQELKRKLIVYIESGNIDRAYEVLHEIQDMMAKHEIAAEVADALAVLDKHGVKYKVWGEADVYQLVDQLPGVADENKRRIVQHVMEGDDWVTVPESIEEASQHKIWEIISGTASDHMEWFSKEALRQL